MDHLLEKINRSAEFLEQRGFVDAAIGVVLGTGLGALIQELEVEQTIDYREIPHFPVSTVEFHKGKLLIGKIGQKRVIAMQGRFHYYEGYSMQQITYPIRVLHKLGIRFLLLSNAAGAINLSFKKGQLVLIDDHINMLPDNPLRGLNDPELGNRFVDMSGPYSAVLNELLQKTATSLDITLHRGTYVSVMGPNLETKAEYRFLRMAGADIVGMSTVPEIIVANHIGLPCAAVSVITDECDPGNLMPVSIAEIIEVAGNGDRILSRLYKSVIDQLT